MRGKSLLNEKAIIILSLNQSECRKLLRSASSRIGFSLDTGIEVEVLIEQFQDNASKLKYYPVLILITYIYNVLIIMLCTIYSSFFVYLASDTCESWKNDLSKLTFFRECFLYPLLLFL